MNLRKIISVLIAVLMVGSLALPFVSASDTEPAPLKFNEDGKFRIMQIADIQDGPNLNAQTAKFIRYAVTKAAPDLIVLTGDNIYGSSARNPKKSEKAIRAVMDVFEELGVPVAIVFGNHDDQSNDYSKEEQMAVYQQYSVNRSVDQADTVAEGVDLEGCGTYNLPILSSDGSKVAFNVWLFDSGSYDADLGGGYDHVREKQIEWYKQESDALKAQNGGEPVYSMAFQHIIVPNVYDALEEVSGSGKGVYVHKSKYYKLPSDATDVINYMGEAPCCSEVDGGEFAAFVEQGDVIAVASGHDHTNAFTVELDGIKIVNTATAGLGSYGEAKSRGIRYFDIDENDTSTYTDGYMLFIDWINGVLPPVEGVEDVTTMDKISYTFKDLLNRIELFFINLWMRIQNLFGVSNLVF